MAHKITLVILLWCICHATAQSQEVKPYYFTGLGRAIVANSQLSGAAFDKDTASATAGTGGYTLFDLGAHVQPFDYVRGTAIVRLRNQFGSFFGEGTHVEVRQLTIDGLIAQRVHYSLGDIDVQMTPYTVFNASDTSTHYESAIFSQRRQISEYENLNNGNNWRVQGGKFKTVLLINDAASIETKGFLSRTRTYELTGLPDRYLAGGSIQSHIGKNTSIGANMASFFEAQDQSSSDSTYRNHVVSGNAAWNTSIQTVDLTVSGESGFSDYNRSTTDSTELSASDLFYDVQLKATWHPLGLTLHANYHHVGAQFYSPAAQTMRIDQGATPQLFPAINNGLDVRGQLQFDRLTQENIYNPTIRAELMYFLPQYGNMRPYGTSTPNRRGFSLGAHYNNPKKWITASANFFFEQEVSGQQVNEKRAFRHLSGGTSLHVHELLDLSRKVIVLGGVSTENTTRNGSNNIQFQVNNIDIGLEIETIENLHVLAGMKQLAASGNEVLTTRNVFNTVVATTPFDMNIQQKHLAWGLSYFFSPKAIFSIHGNYVLVSDKQTQENGYQLRQYFVNYTLQF